MRATARRLLTSLVNLRAVLPLLKALEHCEPDCNHWLKVLTWHRVEDAQGFERQVEFLRSHHAVVSMDDLLEARNNGKKLPPRAVMITFDDGYRNFAQSAWPALKKHQLPVTLFVPTAFPGAPALAFWWDRLEQSVRDTKEQEVPSPLGVLPVETQRQRDLAFRQLKEHFKRIPPAELSEWMDRICTHLGESGRHPEILDWTELRALAADGVHIGAHSRTHRMLNFLSPEDLEQETLGSTQDLKRELGTASPAFAYPAGRYSPAVVDALRRAGFAVAFTTVPGTNDLRRVDWLRLLRINVGPRARVGDLRARMIRSSALWSRWQRVPDHR